MRTRGLNPDSVTDAEDGFRRIPTHSVDVGVDRVAATRSRRVFEARIIVFARESEGAGDATRLRNLRRNDRETTGNRGRQSALGNFAHERNREGARGLNPETATHRDLNRGIRVPADAVDVGLNREARSRSVDESGGGVRRRRNQRAEATIRRGQLSGDQVEPGQDGDVDVPNRVLGVNLRH